jgi:hypothetical protein
VKNEKMTFYILKKDIIFFRISYEENCSYKIMTIFMRIISNTKKLLNFFEKNIDDSTCRKTLKNTSFRAQNVSWQNRLNISFMNYFNHYRFFKNSKITEQWILLNLIIDLSLNKRREQIYDVILIIIDRYTKYFRCISTRKDWTAKHLTNELFDEIFFKQEMSKFIIFDKDSLFTFNFWSNFCYHLKIKIRLNIVFHFQTNEQTKRQNQTLKQYLKIYVNYQQDNWARLLFVIEYAYNNNWHNVIKMNSFAILYRDDDVSKWKNQIQKNSEKNVSATRASVEKITKLRDQLYKRLKETRNNQAKYYDEKHTSRIFNVEDKILLNFKNIHIFKSSKKLDHKYYESFEIEKLIEK